MTSDDTNASLHYVGMIETRLGIFSCVREFKKILETHREMTLQTKFLKIK